ncbi:MAG: endonuclease NucS [Anaerolineae bacterium]|nr:endonuclease NucS [Anaerolineae bacterium]
MPIKTEMWRINNGLKKVTFSAMETEKKLESILAEDVTIIDKGLMLIGRQIPTAYGKFIDLLAIDQDGHLVVIELKRNQTPREVVAQILDYASWVQSLTYEDITQIYIEYSKNRFEQAFFERFDAAPPESLNEEHRLIIVAAELDNSTERILGYLSENYNVPINVAFFRYFKQDNNEYLTRAWFIDPLQAEAQSEKANRVGKGTKEPWNGRDYYVSFGEGQHRLWEDAINYGFISAGQGKWYSNTLSLLTIGARVFVCIPKVGYVGVGIVQDIATPVKDFKVNIDDKEISILQAPLLTPKIGENADNPELSEYLVKVEWIKTLPAKQAIWVKGMFANQNSACKLRNKFTLERLVQLFQLEE